MGCLFFGFSRINRVCIVFDKKIPFLQYSFRYFKIIFVCMSLQHVCWIWARSRVMAYEFTRPNFGSKSPSAGAKPKKKVWPSSTTRLETASLPVRQNDLTHTIDTPGSKDRRRHLRRAPWQVRK